jgi:hypothetical protein
MIPESITEPTLVIGWGLIKKFYPGRARLLENKIDTNLYWCFSPLEKRGEYRTYISKFYKYILDEGSKNIEYKIFNIFKVSFQQMKTTVEWIGNNKKKYIYVSPDSLFVYVEGKVIQLNFADTDFMGVSRDRIVKLFYGNKNNHIFYDYDFIGNDFNKLMYNKRYLIPFLKSLSNV